MELLLCQECSLQLSVAFDLRRLDTVMKLIDFGLAFVSLENGICCSLLGLFESELQIVDVVVLRKVNIGTEGLLNLSNLPWFEPDHLGPRWHLCAPLGDSPGPGHADF